jgi:hypothetical protein
MIFSDICVVFTINSSSALHHGHIWLTSIYIMAGLWNFAHSNSCDSVYHGSRKYVVQKSWYICLIEWDGVWAPQMNDGFDPLILVKMDKIH